VARPADAVRAVRRWLHEPPFLAFGPRRPEEAGPRPSSPARLVAECRRLHAEVTGAGGSTIDSPLPSGGPGPLAARTLVQPDGDFICLVDPCYLADASVRLAHQQRVEQWMGEVRGTVTEVVTMVRTASVAAAGVLGATTGLLTGIVAGAVYSLLGFAVSFLTVPLFREGLKGILRRALR